MLIRDEENRIVATNLASARMLEKIIQDQKKADIVLDTGMDNTDSRIYTLAGDADSVWNRILGMGHSCMSRI